MNKKEPCFATYPKRNDVLNFVFQVRNYLHPGYFEPLETSEEKYRESKLKEIKDLYETYICKFTSKEFLKELPHLKEMLDSDVEFFLESDPAIEQKEEVVITYPGYFAILFYRIAHILYKLEIPLVPRVITEIAHSMTGIDIHPGARIGYPFFIDHGTGIVIGETTIIGHHVKIYQGVTLGALSLSKGRLMKGIKRHPTIKNYVTIYANASILGGDVTIGNNVTIGGNVFLMESIPDNTRVLISKPDLIMEKK